MTSDSSPVHPQIPFSFDYTATSTFDLYWPGDNGVAVDAVATLATGESQEAQVFLSGATGTGKTHLLMAACQQASAVGFRIAYLSAADIEVAASLEGLEQFDVVCLDDMDRLPRQAESEEALFHFINRARESHARLLMASRTSPVHLRIDLADLATRLTWGASFKIEPVPEEALGELLVWRAGTLGLVLGDDEVHYLLSRFPRDPVSLLDALGKLDQASMQLKRRITTALIREVLVPTENR